MPSSSPQAALSAAASALTARALRAAPREAVVVGAHRLGLYLSLDGTVLPVVPSDAVALPTALRLGARSSALPGVATGTASGAMCGAAPWGVEPGDRVLVGGGRVVLPDVEVVVVRTWRPARVRRVAPGAARLAPAAGVVCSGGRRGSHVGTRLDEVAEVLAEATASCDPWLAPAIRVVCSGGRQGSHLGTRLDDVAALVGRGQGLTPSGDDALAGALLVAHAMRAAGPLAEAVRSRLGATTAVSGALLGAAADGFAAAPVVALVDAAVVGHVGATARALPDVVAIGHTSGRDLLAGVLAALLALFPAAGAEPEPATPPTDLTSPNPQQTPTGRSAA